MRWEDELGSLSLTHWAILLGVALLLFGRGRIAGTMGDLGHGLRRFRDEMRDEDA
jgi:sec-independent protein translocase protein TatA